MFDGDSSGVRASYKVAIMALSLISPNKYLQFISLPEDIDPDKYINEYSLSNFLSILKNPDPLSHFIFNQSIKSLYLVLSVILGLLFYLIVCYFIKAFQMNDIKLKY